ncbi:unnamed protein product [Eruca vesicaria subsp. sativa]|uniref:Uncharacterized protein n=1 Tax=Eruca vesicaria subsp. sativa TaxID=29727 RepID=A0ABC8M348_ERUVS|nr:unnamed protein product [Eruca vesicaria subsp. sativa]
MKHRSCRDSKKEARTQTISCMSQHQSIVLRYFFSITHIYTQILSKSLGKRQKETKSNLRGQLIKSLKYILIKPSSFKVTRRKQKDVFLRIAYTCLTKYFSFIIPRAVPPWP